MLRPALVLFAFLALLTGVAYPLAITGISLTAFPGQAGGSLIRRDGRVLGSRLLAQPTEDPRYFWGRLSATGGFPGNAGSSGGSNLSAHHPALRRAAERRLQALREADPGKPGPVPADLATASASGLDPHISPAGAEYQLARIAKARGQDQRVLRTLVRRHTEGRLFGLLGEPRVNVLELNLELDTLPPARVRP